MPRDKSVKKVLVIGSGPIVIGQAAEFDYAGAQACGVLKAEGVNVVLANSNPATIMTDRHLADEIYLEPLNADTIKRIIEKEQPDSLLAGLGGQTGLTIAMIKSRFSAGNTELVDINHMRTSHREIRFSKMQDCGNDYIFIENFDGSITAPESLCVSLCDRHTGIGGDGIVLIERSDAADAKMRSFNRDGSEGKMAGNNIRSVGKYLCDRGYVKDENISVETASGVKKLRLFLRNGKVNSVSVDMGNVSFDPGSVPVITAEPRLVNSPVTIGGTEYNVTVLSVGNPHCVIFSDEIDGLDLRVLGPKFEHVQEENRN